MSIWGGASPPPQCLHLPWLALGCSGSPAEAALGTPWPAPSLAPCRSFAVFCGHAVLLPIDGAPAGWAARCCLCLALGPAQLRSEVPLSRWPLSRWPRDCCIPACPRPRSQAAPSTRRVR